MTADTHLSRRGGRLIKAARNARGGDPSGERALESLALGVGAVAFIGAGLVSLWVFRLDPAPIAGAGSVGEYAAIAAAVAAVLAFVGGRILVRRPGRRVRVLDVVDIAALALAHAVVALLTWTLLSVILERGFVDAVVFPLPAILLAGAATAVTAYLVFASATHMDLQLLAVILAVFLVEGILTSTLTASDTHWWQENLSALGMTNDISSLVFNLTLIVGGVLVTTLARYSTRGIPTPRPRGVLAVRISLVTVGILLGLVGVFPVDRFFLLHTLIASGMAVAFGVLVILLPRWLPGIPRTFIGLGWVFIAIIVVLALLFVAGSYTLTAVELVAGVLVFSWIVLFIRNAHALQQDVVDGAG